MTLLAPTPAIDYQVVKITPAVAAEYLTHNTDNRSVRQRQVDAFARDMSAGKWQLTGDPVRFDVTGKLSDAQHRLLAVVQSGVTIEAVVIRNLPVEVRDVIDSGAARTAGDMLKFARMESSFNVAAAARIALARENGVMSTALSSTSPKYTHAEIKAWAVAHPDLLDAVKMVSKGSVRKLREAAATYCGWEFRKVDVAAAEDFFDSIYNLRTDGKGDPRFALLNYFSSAANARRSVPTAEAVYVLFRTWNALRAGEKLSRIQTLSAASTDSKKVGITIPALL